MPSPYLIVAIQFILGLVIFGTLFQYHVIDRLRQADVFLAVAPLLLFQGLRLLGLTMLAPGQVAAGQDMGAIEILAYGDLAAAVTGVAAALAAYRRSSLTVPLAWLFTVVGLADLASVSITVASAGTLEQGIGVMWVTFGLIAPFIVLSHGYVLYALTARRREFSAAAPLRDKDPT
ncbi:MAG: hypothetical protein WBG89_10610 [Ornithinimicrobium sp.]